MIAINLLEKLVELRIGYSKSSSFECGLQFPLIQLAVIIFVNRKEEAIELVFGLLDKSAKLWCTCISMLLSVGGVCVVYLRKKSPGHHPYPWL